MNDTVSTEELVRLRDSYVQAFEQWREKNTALAIAQERMDKARDAFEAAGGTKELMRRSVELEESNVRPV